jgi:hypothetical protein
MGFGSRMLAALLGLFLATTSAFAFRILPDNVLYGELKHLEPPYMMIGDKVYRIAPGSKIRDQNNRILVPVSAPTKGRIAYNFDYLGQILGVWFLTPAEIEAVDARAKDR